MARSKVDERLEGVSQKDKNEAQQKLNKLCDEHNLERIDLNHGKGQWRELCYRMVGLPHQVAKPAGRKSIMSKEEKDDFFWSMYIGLFFTPIDDDGNKIKGGSNVERHINSYLERRALADRATKYTGKTYIAKDTLRNYWLNEGRVRAIELHHRMLEEQQKEDWSDVYDND